MKSTLLIIFGIILSVIVAIFALSNNNTVAINYLFGKGEVLIPLLILSLVAFGAAITLIFSIPSWWRKRTEKVTLKKENKKLTVEVSRLRDELIQAKQSITKPQATEFYENN